MIATIALVIVALVALAAAVACSAADGAMLASEPPEGTDDPEPFHRRVERVHRGLALARVMALLVAGCAVGGALYLRAYDGLHAHLRLFIAALAMAVLTDVIGRSAGDALGERALARLEGLVRGVERWLAPAVSFSERVDGVLQSSFPAAHAEEVERVATEQFREVVAADAEVAPEEVTLIRGVFSLGETPVRDIMVPRVEIEAIDRASPWSEVLDRVRSSGHARLPVFDETIDNMVGILYAKDLLPSAIADEPPPSGWQSLVRAAVFIPATKTLDRQLRDFRTGRFHIAIVVDEYGGTAGLVTIEDILEEIVGEIRDERDVEEPPMEERDGYRYWVAGRVPVHDLEEWLGHHFEHEDSATVGGLIYERLGRVPRAGEEMTIDDFRVVVERVSRRSVQRVYFERTVPATGQGRTA